MELLTTIGDGSVYNQWAFTCCCGNSTVFTGKIKIRWKWPCIKGGIKYDFLFCRHVSTFFQKRQLLPVSLTFCVISKINYKTKMKTGITADFIFWGFINRGKHSRMFWKMLLIKCRKNSCAGVLFLKKVKGWNKFILM